MLTFTAMRHDSSPFPLFGADRLEVSHLSHLFTVLSSDRTSPLAFSNWRTFDLISPCVHSHNQACTEKKKNRPGCSCSFGDKQSERYKWFSVMLRFDILCCHLLFCLSPLSSHPHLLPIIHLYSDVPYSSFQLRLGFVLQQRGAAAYDVIKDWELIGCNK